MRIAPSAHFPKFVIHRGALLYELRKAMGTSKLIDSSAAFLFEVPESDSPLVMQELRTGGTSNTLPVRITSAWRLPGIFARAVDRRLADTGSNYRLMSS